MVAFFMGAE